MDPKFKYKLTENSKLKGSFTLAKCEGQKRSLTTTVGVPILAPWPLPQ
jgi:hypothetical protein